MMYEELVYKLRHCNLYGEEPLHWVGIICDAAEAIEKLQSELKQVKVEREALLKEKAEREKGCDFCNAEYAVMSGSCMSSELIHKGCVAKFCPNCGKRLVSEE